MPHECHAHTISQIIVPEEERNDPEFRYLDTNCGILPNKRHTYGIPLDIIDFFRQANGSTEGEPSDRPNTLDDVINNRLENVSNTDGRTTGPTLVRNLRPQPGMHGRTRCGKLPLDLCAANVHFPRTIHSAAARQWQRHFSHVFASASPLSGILFFLSICRYL